MELPGALALIRKYSLPSLVQEELERLILAGQLPPGAPLREIPLAAQLGVSRGPVREAFRGLKEKGLVEVVKNCGVRVRVLSLVQADQIYEVRIALETLIGRLLAQTILADGLAELHRLLEDMSAAAKDVDIDRYTALNLRLHDRMAALTGNAKLHESYVRLVDELSLFRRQAYVHNQRTLGVSLREHKAIVKAIAAGDARLAAQLLGEHAERSRLRMHAALDLIATGGASVAKEGIREANNV